MSCESPADALQRARELLAVLPSSNTVLALQVCKTLALCGCCLGSHLLCTSHPLSSRILRPSAADCLAARLQRRAQCWLTNTPTIWLQVPCHDPPWRLCYGLQTLGPQELCRRLSDAGLCLYAFHTHHDCVGVYQIRYSMHLTDRGPRSIGGDVRLSLLAFPGEKLSLGE